MEHIAYEACSRLYAYLRRVIFAIAAAFLLLTFTYGSAQVETWSKLDQISNISYAANSFSIGNAYKGWWDLIEGSPTCNGHRGTTFYCYRWGYIGGDFQNCGWIGEGTQIAYKNMPVTKDPCSKEGTKIPPDKQHKNFFPVYTDGFYNNNPGDGTATLYEYGSSNPYGGRCQSPGYAYGNVDPWKNPATPSDAFPIGNHVSIAWRYITLDNQWTMVRLIHPPAGQPSWVFVGSWCLKDPSPDDPQNVNYGYPNLVYYPTQGGNFGRSVGGALIAPTNQHTYLLLYQQLSRAKQP